MGCSYYKQTILSMRSDLHVHTKASGMFNLPGLKHLCQECYNEPLEVYDLLKRRGMSAITVTDHDSIEGSEALRSFSDFFLSEEVTVRMPSGTEAHLGVYNLTERDHLEIKRRANDFVSLLMYLTERKLFFSVNHVFSGLTGRREADDFAWFESYVPAYEARNGQMWRKSNECAAQLAARLDKIAVAGSDAHALSGVGLTYTEVPGARTVNEFFAGLRAGSGRVAGEHGSYGRLTADVLSIIGSFFSDMPWTAVLSPLALLVPVFSAGHWMNEVRFCRKWRAVMEDRGKRQRKLWDIDPSFEANWAS
jgi:predicted metal-dependent phosphoesterase TrpH